MVAIDSEIKLNELQLKHFGERAAADPADALVWHGERAMFSAKLLPRLKALRGGLDAILRMALNDSVERRNALEFLAALDRDLIGQIVDFDISPKSTPMSALEVGTDFRALREVRQHVLRTKDWIETHG